MQRTPELVHEIEHIYRLTSDAIHLLDEFIDADEHQGSGTRRHPNRVQGELEDTLQDIRVIARNASDAAERNA